MNLVGAWAFLFSTLGGRVSARCWHVPPLGFAFLPELPCLTWLALRKFRVSRHTVVPPLEAAGLRLE
jgi:hypothetical protein